MLSGPGSRVQRHTGRLPGRGSQKALQSYAFFGLSGCQRHTGRLPGPGALAGQAAGQAARVSLDPGVRAGCPARAPGRAPGSCVAGLSKRIRLAYCEGRHCGMCGHGAIVGE